MMKKILLVCTCLLTLTACSTSTQTNQDNKSNLVQSKAKKEKVKTKTFSNTMFKGTSIRLKVRYTKEKVTDFDFITEKEIPKEERNKSHKELTDIYQAKNQKDPLIARISKLKGIKLAVRISADREFVAQSITFDLSKVNKDEINIAMGLTNKENTMFEKLEEKPEVFFEALRKQGFKEE